jgi:hypothetical protein
MGLDATLPVAVSPASAPADPQSASNSTSKSSDWDFSFHNLLDIINPLEHLPIIGTLYRAITGTHIGIPEKIAGDALYGGLWGAVSGVADAAFEAVTGKDFGSTVLALFTGHHPDTAVASNAPANVPTNVLVTPPVKLPALPESQAPGVTPDMAALQTSLSRNGVDGDLAQRAMSAYRKSIALPGLVPFPAS